MEKAQRRWAHTVLDVKAVSRAAPLPALLPSTGNTSDAIDTCLDGYHTSLYIRWIERY
jgi:hypothetical protein